MDEKDFTKAFEVLEGLGAVSGKESYHTLGEGIRTSYRHNVVDGKEDYTLQLLFDVGEVNPSIARRVGQAYGLNFDGEHVVFEGEDVSPANVVKTAVLYVEIRDIGEAESMYAKMEDVYAKLLRAAEEWESKQDEAVDEFLRSEEII
jgi:hypothetical protein